jgi:hypothetical protein
MRTYISLCSFNLYFFFSLLIFVGVNLVVGAYIPCIDMLCFVFSGYVTLSLYSFLIFACTQEK